MIDTDGDGKPDKKQELLHQDPKDKSQTFTILSKEIVEKEVIFSKVNIASEEIAGAKIQIKDEQGQVVKEWISKEGQSETVKLKAGTYIFHEEVAPNGYLKVTDITFEVDEQGKVTVKNANGNEVKTNGNKLTVTDKKEVLTPEKPWTPMIPPTRDVKVTIDWKGSNGNKIKAPVDSIKVELYKDGTATGNVKELNKRNNWTVAFKGLPVSATLGGKKHKYTIKEVGENSNSVLIGGERYKVAYKGNMKDGFIITSQKETSTKPFTPTPNNPGSNKPRVPNTGDRNNIFQYTWFMFTSGVLLVLIGYRRKNQV